jgi:ABC-type glycerol-3-phosphate transport system substrate-binding protein
MMANPFWRKVRISIILVFVLVILSACSSRLPAISQEATATSIIGAVETPIVIPSNTEAALGPVQLTIWLGPEFSPSRGDLAAQLLQNQLDSFQELNPNVQIDIRIKEEVGEGNLIDSLLAAQSAAPIALPDLVLLSSDVMPKAIKSNLLLSLDARLSETLNDDWYSFGLQAVQQEGQSYGLPLAGDALILMHRFSALEQLPQSWERSLQEPLAIAFAAADANAYFSLLHLANGTNKSGPLTEDSTYSAEQIEDLLTYYFDGEAIGVFPFWLSQFDNQEQSWQAFVEGQSAMAVTWSSRFLSSSDSNLGAGLLPTQDGQGFSLAKTWSWALINRGNDLSPVTVELAQHLTTPEFIAQWTSAVGLLPTRSSSLTAWSPDDRQVLASQVAPIANVMPPPSIRNQIGLTLSEIIVALLKQEISLDFAVQTVQTNLSSFQ